MRRTRAGYTLIEIMTAVVVMTIGATGIVAMQGASVHSNQDANETSTAINFATTWVERLKRDARLWTTTGSAALASTKYLNNALDTYFVPNPEDTRESYGADYFGFDTRGGSGNPAIHYCINVQLAVAHAFDPAGGTDPLTNANALRADVRVWWYRWGPDANRRSGPACTPTTGVLTADHLKLNTIRRHYLSTVLSWRAP